MKRTNLRSVLSILATAALLFSFSHGTYGQKPGEKHEGKICQVSSFSMNKICKEWDGQWQGRI